jgi:hypothetical protein
MRRPAYRRVWLARTISQVGDVAQFTTLALLLIALTGSGLEVSGAVLAEILPVLLLRTAASRTRARSDRTFTGGSCRSRSLRVRRRVRGQRRLVRLVRRRPARRARAGAAPSVQLSSSFAHVREALAALGQIPLLKALAVGQFVAALSAGATSALLVVLAQERLGGGEAFGLLVACIGAGAALGPLLLLRRIKDPRRPLFVSGPYAVRGVVDLVLAAVTALPLAAAAVAVYGLSTSTGNVTFSSLVQSRVRDELRGRAFAGFDVLWQTGRLSTDAVGPTTDWWMGRTAVLGRFDPMAVNRPASAASI